MAKQTKTDLMTKIAALYADETVLKHAPEGDRNLAGHVAQQLDAGKRVRTTTGELADLLDRLEAYADAGAVTNPEPAPEPAQEEATAAPVTCSTPGCDTVLDADRIAECERNGWALECDPCSWGDTPDKLAQDAAQTKRDAERAKAEEERKAASSSNGRKKDSTPGRSRSNLSPEGEEIVGEGLPFTGTVKGVTYSGTLLPTCEVVIDGTTYSSPFNAVNKLSGTRYNGWAIFKFEDPDTGETKPLDTLRNGSMGYADRKPRGGKRSPLERAQAEVDRLERSFRKAAEKAAELEGKLEEARRTLAARQGEAEAKPEAAK